MNKLNVRTLDIYSEKHTEFYSHAKVFSLCQKANQLNYLLIPFNITRLAPDEEVQSMVI